MAKEAPLDLSPFGKVVVRTDTSSGRPMTRINYPGRGRVEKTHASVAEANLHLIEEHQRSLWGRRGRRPAVTVRELAGVWYERRRRRGLERKTLAADEAYLKARILPYWGDWKADHITPLDVQDWIDELEAVPLSEGMVKKYRTALDGILREAIRQGMIGESPASVDLVDITINRSEPGDGKPTFTEDELTALWHIIDPRARALIPLGAYGAGLRIGEWAGLAETDFDPRTLELKFRRKVVDVKGKVYVEEWLKGRNPGRVILLGEDMAAILTTHIGRFAQNGWVFPAPKGGVMSPGNFRNRIWKPAVTAIGRPDAKFHWLRHTNVSALREEGLDLETVSKHVGHANVEITSRFYSHQTDAINEGIAAAQDRLLARLDLSPLASGARSGAEVVQLSERKSGKAL